MLWGAGRGGQKTVENEALLGRRVFEVFFPVRACGAYLTKKKLSIFDGKD